MSITPIPLTITGLSEEECFEGSTFYEAIKAILAKVRVLVPDSITNVVVGNEEPNDSQRDYVWFRLDNAGNYVGTFLYTGGDWKQIDPVPQALTWVYGDSTSPPDGYLPANDASISVLTSGEKTALELLWYPSGAVGPWSIYQVVYVGF